jgi:hypothetical protein
MLMTDVYGMAPGLTTARETYEAEFRWGSQFQGIMAGALIDGSTIDSGNSPTYELRPGLLLGQVISTGKWKQYSPTASDGTEVANAVLMEAIRMQDFSGNNVDRFYGLLVGGPVQASKIIGLDNMARQQMDKFIFDDIFGLMGNHWFGFKRFQTKTANYTVVANDNYTHFDNLGAGGAVTFTLPPILPGYMFAFSVVADQNVLVTSSEGGNIVGFNNAVASTVSFQTGGARIGGTFKIYSNPAGTKWFVQTDSAGANTVTTA